MNCTRCGQPLQKDDRFCLHCGCPVESAWPETAGSIPLTPVQQPDPEPAVQTKQPVPETDPWHGTDPWDPRPAEPVIEPPMAAPSAPTTPRRKNRWVVPAIIAICLLTAALAVGGILLTVSLIRENREPELPASSAPWTPAEQVPPSVNQRELADCIGLSVDEVKARTGLSFQLKDGAYVNQDSSVLITAAGPGGTVDMVVLSDKDVGFSLCSVKIGMNREKARDVAGKTLTLHNDYDETVLSGEYGDNLFAAYFGANGTVNYIMYVSYTSDDLAGTGVGHGTGLWFVGETIDSMHHALGQETTTEAFAGGGTAFYYEQEGLYLITNDDDPTGESRITAVSMGEGAQFSEAVYIGMTYDEIIQYVDLSYLYVDSESGYRVADYAITLDGIECVGTFMFAPMDEKGAYSSINAFVSVSE